MKQRFFVILGFAVNILCPVQASACDFAPGKYQQISESEFSVSLELNKNAQFVLTQERWLAGAHGQRETHIYRGTWKCDHAQLELHYSTQTVQGIWAEEDLSHYGKVKSAKSLHFAAQKTEDHIFNGVSFWPQSVILSFKS
ncbi:hypothetical protein [Undibacterium rugosum]|uniref:Uncharacterized protein n=1 Tax=Undibacterium rugosum TaxID=2762291 RepID=A0A923HZ59_9BURK|nr:hypothetical protein [Undibacterium rugosum]MBC3934007.1 hypothetical protein [Undibacterium rugosum]MBR7777717.1 hypothetical protein [Undibacterium rugosum]